MAPDPTSITDGDVAATFCATLVDEWVRNGMRHAVLSPGSRSTPMALAMHRNPQLSLHVHHDERSAAYMALGLALSSGSAAALLCTSGTAAVQFHAAVVEAHQAFVPMLVITADRPAELHGVGAPQTIDQRDLYGASVRWYCEPGTPAVGGMAWWRDLACDAWVRTCGEQPGPVHLNLAFREPLLGQPGQLPPERDGDPARAQGPAPRWGLRDEQLAALAPAISRSRGVILAGARAARSVEDARAVHELASALGWPLLADGASGCRLGAPGCVTAFDPLLRHEPFAREVAPEVVLRLGGLLASKVVGQWAAASGALQIGVDRYGAVPDPDGVVGERILGDVALVCDQLRAAAPDAAPTDWTDTWSRAEDSARQAVSKVLSAHPEATEPGTAVDVMSLLSDGALLVASSSMPVRDLEWFAPARRGVTMLSNRGANGIDGVMSTAVGAALGGAPTALLVGDVAFLHDTNALLGLAGRTLNLVIVVIDNDGGGIFSFLPQRTALDDATYEALFGTPHGLDLVAVSTAHGVPAERVSTRAGVRAAVAGALTRGGPRVVVVETDRSENVEVHAQLNDAVAVAWDRVAGDKYA